MSAFEKIAGLFPSRSLGESVAREVLGEHAHELAEQQRAHLKDQGYDTDCVCEACSACLAQEYIDLIDPEVKR